MKYPEMRRKDRALSRREAFAILEKGEYGVLSTAGADGVPAGVPLSYVVDGESICFHCALQGQKIRNMTGNPSVSFVVVGDTQPVYKQNYTTLYESAVVHGTASRVEDGEEKTRLLRLLCEKYLPAHMDRFEEAMGSLPVTDVWRIQIHRLTGKARR